MVLVLVNVALLCNLWVCVLRRMGGNPTVPAVAFASAICLMNVVRCQWCVRLDSIAPLNAVAAKAVGRRLFIAQRVIAALSFAREMKRVE